MELATARAEPRRPLARLHAGAAQDGQADKAVAVLEDLVTRQGDRPTPTASRYQDMNRGADAVKTSSRPGPSSQPRSDPRAKHEAEMFNDAEAAFRQVLATTPRTRRAELSHTPTAARADESVGLLKNALQIDPENGSHWTAWLAYHKENKLDLAADTKRAADQLRTNGVIQTITARCSSAGSLRRSHRDGRALAGDAEPSIAPAWTRRSRALS